ncbi:carboxypeptidase-like regulatory domain-containing protein [Tenacibaculum aquimarinum]|uniref:carboxypeptidase-like regulatory domain-containing protein n=1 Tax=Tenacibaculum aquimarinum TaxID=2910675 RepID=UPI001F0A4181|nr:carboxypeptidase-like regulatory domain-containing protein [Tenacibaculum aquimarinum]MCH3883829.1 carboxypeptidase-like regulatory domain-containing protein [Tenacibaculum aquimarinum]
MNFKKLIVYYFLFFCAVTFTQNNRVIVGGVVTDSLQNPLQNVTLIAKPKQQNIKIKYAITDTKGYYKLQLKKGVFYQLSISHLGYNSINKEVLLSENNSTHNFKLNTKKENLDEVVINYKYQPIKKKKDTITYNLKSFTNGNEFKMKDVLNKLPGIKVDKNAIKVQGKTVTKLLVEGKPFFNGSTKLAIENIPADVMDKIEIISNYKESELLRNLADNEDLALNVVLKEDKKDFAFGDIEAGVGLDNFYSLHATLFKYNPKSNISFIGDINSFNNSSLSFSDLSRLVGGSSNLFKRSALSNTLSSFASNNAERFESVTRFSALNFQKEFSTKFTISGYVIYSNNDIVNKSSSIREYLGEEPIFETRNDIGDTDNSAALFNIKFDYNPSSSQKWIYNVNYIKNTTNYEKESISNLENTNQFFTSVEGKSDSFSHNLEGYLKLNDKHTMGLALHHSITNSNSTDNWSSNTVFLEEFLPLTQTTNYQINQINDINAQRFNILLKDYWLASRYFHLFYNIGFNYKNSKIRNDISQVFQDNSRIDFSELGNNNPLTLSDLNFGFGIKSKLGKFEFNLEAKPHYYRFKRAQIKDTNFFIEPKLNINYKIEDDIDLDFDYTFTNRYLNDLNYLENLKVTGFNSLLQGNPNLIDERSHNFSLYYSDYENIDDYFLDFSIDYSINNPVKNNSITQSGIYRLSTPVILNLPEENLSFNTNYGLIFSKSSLEFEVDLDWFKTNQVINEDVSIINSFEYLLSSKWLLKLTKNTQINLKYKHSGYQVTSDEDSRSIENTFSLNFDSKFLKNFIFKTDFSTHFVKNFSDNTLNYTLQNLYLGYAKPNSKFSYSLNFRNIYNNGVITTNSFSSNLLISNQVFTLPRVFLVELKYKF